MTGFVTKWLLSLLRSRGAKAPEEMALTVAMAYLAFYLANAPGMTACVTLRPELLLSR